MSCAPVWRASASDFSWRYVIQPAALVEKRYVRQLRCASVLHHLDACVHHHRLVLIATSRRRRGSGSPRCGQCGYNLTGAPSNRCPECGLLFIEAGVLIRSPGWRRRWRVGIALLVVPLILTAISLVSTTVYLRRQTAAARQAAANSGRRWRASSSFRTTCCQKSPSTDPQVP